MSASSRKAKRKPRRKAGKASRQRATRKLVFSLAVDEQEISVTYTSRRFPGMATFEFESPHTPERRSVVSGTGYLCHCVLKEQVDWHGGPQDYARAYVEDLIQRSMDSFGVRQLSLL